MEISGGFDGFLEFVTDLNKSLDIPSTITEFGIQEIDIEKENMTRDDLFDKTGGRTVPQIIINGN